MTVAASKRRPRRIAADEAHSWARNLKLGNPYAKLVLSMLTIYVNGEGSCFVSAASLAEDCELALETVRRRLAWLETVGAVARFPQWVDEHGRRNGEGRGRRTTDDIRLMINSDPDEIEAKAHGNGDDSGSSGSEQTPQSDPLREGGATDDEESISPLATPSLGMGPKDSEPEPEERTPNPLSGGVRTIDMSESFKPFAEAYPAPITDMAKAITIWTAMTDTERIDALTGAKGYRFYIDGERQAKRNRAVKDAHRWLRDKLWLGYLNAGKTAESVAERFDAREDSDEWKAWSVFYRCCGQSGIPAFLISDRAGTRIANMPKRWPPVGREYDPNSENWTTAIWGTGQCAAWLRRLRELPGARIATRTILKDGHSVQALMVPSEWPPKRGSASPTQPSDEDVDELANEFSK